MQWVNHTAFARTLDFVLGNQYSDFYRTKYAAAGMLPEEARVADISTLPFLTRSELQDTPLSRRLFVPSEEMRFAAFTSGTTSKQPLIVPFARVENYFFEPSLGVDVSRVLVIHPPMMKAFGQTFVQQCTQATRALGVLFGDLQSHQNSALLAAEVGCDAVYSIPTVAAQFAPYAKARGIAGNIKLLALTSETLTQARRAELSEAFPNALIGNLYGSAELGQLPFFTCPHMMRRKQNRFHILTDALAAVEVVDGELVVTYGLNRATPLVRYKTGDCMEEVSEGCACGLPGPVLQWSHRAEADRVRLNGVEFDVYAADAAVAKVSPAARLMYQVHLYPGTSVAPRMVVEIVRPELEGENARAFEAHVAATLPDEWRISPAATLRAALEKGLIENLIAVVVPRLSVEGVKAKCFVNHCQ